MGQSRRDFFEFPRVAQRIARWNDAENVQEINWQVFPQGWELYLEGVLRIPYDLLGIGTNRLFNLLK